MSDIIDDAVLQTGTVMTELVAKAKEAHASGQSRRDFFARTAQTRRRHPRSALPA